MELEFNEFQESDIIFSDYSSDQSIESNDEENGDHKCSNKLKRRKSVKNKPRISSSMPINIPGGNNSFRYDIDVAGFESSDEDFGDDADQMMRLPPHEIVGRRVNAEVARSFSPLKGKNLCEVRDSILRMTGFLER